ncbi:sterol desaturase family protein [Lentilitoribacter sp. Alg239-R112]|uniref:sterol desaturase family protein n=1 Tax=Lentilitoribacter sp. Alg239-R112 TaxID=2305987 RepID=UPI0013A68E6F|nr:sterol desaturase family protein [Lentilitoribacter sp. Alg239-R112]
MNIETIEKLGTEIDDVFFIIGAVILLIEIAEAWFKGSLKGKNILEMLASASTQIPYLFVEIFIMTSAYGLYYILAENLIPWELPINWWVAILAIIAADFTYYWEHRISHQVRILWTQHAVHHSSREFNIITGVRFGPFEGVWSMVAHIPMIAVGFPPDLVFFGILTVLAYQTWIHTETIGKLGPLEWILNTPSHHRVHHGSDRKYLDKNYGGISIIWDRLFGSFQVEEETPKYGLMRNFDSRNPIKVWFSEIPGLWQDLRKAKTSKEIFMRLFAPPGWRPK